MKKPKFGLRVVGFVKALAAFVADGCETVSPDEYRERLEVCQHCDRRDGYQCAECGCLCALKAKGAVWDCPLNRWPQRNAPESSTTNESGVT